jgi:pSer/pThr/pTyr-binding forkhead associated (FHA) protein
LKKLPEIAYSLDVATALDRGTSMSNGHDTDEHTETTVHGQSAVMGRARITYGTPALEQLSGVGAPRMIRLLEDRYVLGRSSQSDLVFECDQMSRQHLEVVRIEQGYAFRDLESTNGVFLNGVRVHSVNLYDGDQLQIGNLVLVYHEAVA